MTCKMCKEVESPAWYTVIATEQDHGTMVEMYCSLDCMKAAWF